MTFQLCVDCMQWVHGRRGMCPDCNSHLELSGNAVTIGEQFAARIGSPVGPLGHVTVARHQPVHDGLLYETTAGILFLPYQQVLVTRMVEEASGSTLWNIAAAFWAPLMFVIPFVRRNRLSEKQVMKSEPVRLNDNELHRLPELLATVPGAFFLGQRTLQKIRCRRQSWQFVCTNGRVVRIAAIAGDALGQRMKAMLARTSWHTLCDADL